MFIYVFTLISSNSQGLQNSHRRHTVFNLIKNRKYDVIFLQETHWTDDLNDSILREWGGKIIFNNFECNARGTDILFSPNFDFQICNNTSDPHGRTVQTLIEHADRKFNFINVSCGAIILSKPSCLMVNSWSDQDGCFLMCEFSYRSKIFRIVNVYAPNRNPERNDFFDLVSSKMDITVPTVLCGDFNCVLDRSVDRCGAAQDDYSRESV